MREVDALGNKKAARVITALLWLIGAGWLAMMIVVYKDDRRTNPDKPNFIVRFHDELSRQGLPPLPY